MRAVKVAMACAAVIAVAVGLALSAGPSDDIAAPSQGSTTPADDAAPQQSTPPPEPDDDLAESVFEAVVGVAPGTEIGLAVYDRDVEAMVTSRDADRPFYTASVVKLLISVAALRDHEGGLPPGPERADIRAMLSRSHDGIASRLWNAHGGVAIVDAFADDLDLPGTSPPSDPGQWALTRMSARDVVTVYEHIVEELLDPASEFIMEALADARRRGADGFDQTFGIPTAMPGTDHAIKQGWMRVRDGLVLNTSGVVGSDKRYIVVLLAHHPAGTGFDDARSALTAGVEELAPALSDA